MNHLTPGIKPEWSYEIPVDKITEKSYVVEFSATEQECRDVTRRLDVTAVKNLEARITLVRKSGAIKIRASGKVSADVTQQCVVSLEPVESHIEEEFEAWFADESEVVSLDKVRQKKQSRVVDAEIEVPDEKNDPEPIIDGRIELGEIAIQNLALALDPYPHAEGAVYKDICEHPESLSGEEARQKPFAGLKEWKEKLRKKDEK